MERGSERGPKLRIGNCLFRPKKRAEPFWRKQRENKKKTLYNGAVSKSLKWLFSFRLELFPLFFCCLLIVMVKTHLDFNHLILLNQ